MPLTGERGWGQSLLVTRRADGQAFAAQLPGYVGIYAFAGVRDLSNAKRIDAAVRRGDMGAVKSLRREAHAEDATCWVHADGWCLSRREV